MVGKRTVAPSALRARSQAGTAPAFLYSGWFDFFFIDAAFGWRYKL